MGKQMSVAIAIVCALAACRSDGPNPTAGAEKALQDANLTAVQVTWDDEARIAHLRGTVDSMSERQRAHDVAATAVGTMGVVLNEVTVRGLNEHTADDLDGRIRSAIDEVLDRDTALQNRDIDIEVTNGVVTVKGDVRTEGEKARVSEIVRAAPGVKDIANALVVTPNP
jgi:osmotically-inducible protein OsmY